MIEEEEVEQSEEPEEGEPLFVPNLAWALALVGSSILVIYLVLRFLGATTYAENNWWSNYILNINVFWGALTASLIFFFFGGIAYLIHLQFVKLEEIAEEVLGSESEMSLVEDEPLDEVNSEEDLASSK